MKNTMPEPALCTCGRRATCTWWVTGYMVRCSRGFDCWRGPERRTARAAIEAWNRVMDRYHALRAAEYICRKNSL